VRLAGGIRLRCGEQGAPDGTPVLLLHGYSDSWFSFSRVLPLLPPEWRVIVPEQRGHGESDRPAGGYAVDDFTRDALELMDCLGIGAAAVVGHSMGSIVAQRVAMLAPERVRRLVLAGSAASARHESVFELNAAVATLSDPVDPGFVRDFQMSCIHRPVPADFLDGVVRESLKVPAHVWKQALAGLLEAEWKPGLGSIRCPTLILWGDRETTFPLSDQQELERAIPDATLKIIPEIGHCFPWEAPGDFVRSLVAFLAQ
jgi:pimeloyl-ACP methyl ester carboxylesterase